MEVRLRKQAAAVAAARRETTRGLARPKGRRKRPRPVGAAGGD